MNFGLPELIIILVIVLLLFGSTRLPKLSRSIGQSIKELREGFVSKGPSTEDTKTPAEDMKTPAEDMKTPAEDSQTSTEYMKTEDKNDEKKV